MAATTSGIASWGVTGTAAGVSGIVTHIETERESILAPEYNELGAVVKQTLYDLHRTATVTVEVDAGTDLPDERDSITVAGVQGYVQRARLLEDNKAYRHIEVTIEAYNHCNSVTDKLNG